jgi:formate dehydrogenase iron-sulfur subunit
MNPLPVIAGPVASACQYRQPEPFTAPDAGLTMLHRLLAEQRELTAVEQFSKEHEAASINSRQSFYRSLLPATEPAPGQQYAFEVDLDRCSGCKACVVACHTLNGLDEQETWRDVGLLVGGSSTLPVIQHVTTACHHCLEPACLSGCPVNAYEKHPVTGIVKHLDDQCIGCQYCTLACPYEVPKYHAGKGIVRKCDMCSDRLAVGEPPACVQACPQQAIAIRIVDRQQIIDDAETSQFLPAAPDPQLTLPTTTFKSRKTLPRNMLPADYNRVHAQHAHLPLVVMLVLTQLSVGGFVMGLVLDWLLPREQAGALRPLLAANALGFGLLALAASTLHLGRPFYAFRAVLGLGHSWLSREIVAFGLFAKLACLYFAALWWFEADTTSGWGSVLSASVAVTGIIGLFCSAMIYVFTGRECWSFTRVFVRFTLTSALLGIAVVWLSLLLLMLFHPSSQLLQLMQDHGHTLGQSVMVVGIAKLAWDAAIFRHLLFRQMTPLRRSAMLLAGELSNVTLMRFCLGLLGCVLLPLFLLNNLSDVTADLSLTRFTIITGMMVMACLISELLERYLFFAACAAPRMPGGIA